MAVEQAITAAIQTAPTLDVDLIDLSKDHVSILDGRSLDQYADATASVISTITAGDLFLIASPVYRGTYTGALKNVLDHLPLEALEGKVVGLIATGATMHHYMSIDFQLRTVLAWFNAYLLPGSVYLDHRAYAGGQLVDQKSSTSLRELGESLVSVALSLRGIAARPACLARESMAAKGHT